MSTTDDGGGGRAALVEALRVRQNAKRGAAIGIAVTGFVFVFFVVLPPEGTTRSPVYYLALAFVLGTALTGLATALLVARRARALARDL